MGFVRSCTSRLSLFSRVSFPVAVLISATQFFIFASQCFADAESIPGQYLIKFPDRVGVSSVPSVLSHLGAVLVDQSAPGRVRLIQTTSGSSANDAALKDLVASGAVEYIEPNYVYTASRQPNDPSYAQLWGMHNTRQTGGTNDVDIDAPEAWNITTGSNDVVVGIVDTGINWTHPDLAPNMWVNTAEIPDNGMDDDGNGVVDDIYGYNAIANSGSPLDDNSHGSHTAGTIGGTGNNGTGIVGVNWNVKLMALKFLSASGSGSTLAAIKAIDYAIMMKNRGVNIRVLNNSWGGGGFSQSLAEAIGRAHDAGILFVAAAGNAGSDNDSTPTYPANYQIDNVLAVAAVDHNGNLASFSNYGANTVDLAAPGVSILSTVLGSSYASYNGTSMATPHVTGIAALVIGHEPSLSDVQLKGRLMATVKPLSTLNNLLVSPGMVNAYNALTSTAAPIPTPSIRYKQHAQDFNFNSTLGTKILSSDDAYGVIDLPFSFPYFRESFTRLAISSNGRVIPLADGESAPGTSDYANALTAGINPYHDDLYPSSLSPNSGVWVAQDASQVTITWIGSTYVDRTSTDPESVIQFQAKLMSSGDIQFQYLDTNTGNSATSYGASASVGLVPPLSANGQILNVSQNTASESVIGNSHALGFSLTATAVRSDYDGDGKSDIVTFDSAAGLWRIRCSASGFSAESEKTFQLGGSGDTPFEGDFDADGTSDIAVWKKRLHQWQLQKSSNKYQSVTTVQWGNSEDLPLVGDFDGDGSTDLALYREKTKKFLMLAASTLSAASDKHDTGVLKTKKISARNEKSQVIVGDFNGDGVDEFISVLTDKHLWTVKNSSGRVLSSLKWGEKGDTPLACDLNGDRKSDRVAVHTGKRSLTWLVRYVGGGSKKIVFGKPGEKPSCRADYDGDGKQDLATYNTKSKTWTILTSGSNAQMKVAVAD